MPGDGKDNENKKGNKHNNRLSQFLSGISDVFPFAQSSSSEDSEQSDYSDKYESIKRKRHNNSPQNNNRSPLQPHPTKQTGTNNLGKQLSAIYDIKTDDSIINQANYQYYPSNSPKKIKPNYAAMNTNNLRGVLNTNYNNSPIQQSPPPQQAETNNRGKQFYNIKPDVSTRIQQIKEDLDDTYSIEDDNNMITYSKWASTVDDPSYDSDYDTGISTGEYQYNINGKQERIKYTSSNKLEDLQEGIDTNKQEMQEGLKTRYNHATTGYFSIYNTKSDKTRYYRIDNIGIAKESCPAKTDYLYNAKGLKTRSHSETAIMRPLLNCVLPKKVKKLGKDGGTQEVNINLFNTYYPPCNDAYDEYNKSKIKI